MQHISCAYTIKIIDIGIHTAILLLLSNSQVPYAPVCSCYSSRVLVERADCRCVNISILDPSKTPYLYVLPWRLGRNLCFSRFIHLSLGSEIDLSDISFSAASLAPMLLLNSHRLRLLQAALCFIAEFRLR